MTIEQRVAQLERNRCCGKPKYYDTFNDFPQPGTTNTLYVDRETGSIYIWDAEENDYIKAGAEDPLFLFQVGVPGYGHIHWAPLTTTQAQFLIQNTNSTFPVADIAQPFVTITAETNGTPGNEHQHDLTVYFDYESHSFVVTDITNNELDNHEAHLIGTAGGGGDIIDTKVVYVDAESGDDTTALRGYRNKPFQTLNGGINAALEGDLLYVFPGNYTQNTPITTWINIHCESGVDWLLQSNFSAATDFALAKTVNWKFDIIRQANYNQFLFQPRNTLGGYNLTANLIEKIWIFAATKNRSVRVNKTINTALGVQSLLSTDPQGTNDVENAEWDYTQGSLTSLFNSQNTSNSQVNFYCKNLKSNNSYIGSVAPTLGFFYGSDIGTNKNINTLVDNVWHNDPAVYTVPSNPLSGIVSWRGSSSSYQNGLFFAVGVGAFRSFSTLNVDLKNVNSNGHLLGLSSVGGDNINLAINISGKVTKGIGVFSLDLSAITNCNIIFNLDITCDAAMGLFLGFSEGASVFNNIQASNTIVVTGRIKTRQTGYPCISIGQGSAASNNTNGTILLKDLTLINDGTVSPIMCAVLENILIQNVKTNSLITDANILEVGESITRNTNYK